MGAEKEGKKERGKHDSRRVRHGEGEMKEEEDIKANIIKKEANQLVTSSDSDWNALLSIEIQNRKTFFFPPSSFSFNYLQCECCEIKYCGKL